VPVGDLDASAAALLLDRFDFVVIAVGTKLLPSWVLPFVQGRFAPSIKLIHHRPGQAPPAVLPRLLRNAPLETAVGSKQLAVWWSDSDELAHELEKQIRQLQIPRRQFRTLEEGVAYVRSLGRSCGKVFLSNASPENDLALEIVRVLQLNNIDFFHYLYRNTMPLGQPWKDRLLSQVAECQIFVPLISESYGHSDWCLQELNAGRALHEMGKLKVIPCFLDRTESTALDIQGITLEHLTRPEQVTTVVNHIDHHLVSAAEATVGGTRLHIALNEGQYGVDIALLAILEEEYEAMARHIDDLQPVDATADTPNQCAWAMGSISGVNNSLYRVVLGLVRKGTTGALIGTRHTIDAFRPRHVILVGIAGALDPRLDNGDIVVSERVFGYEYGAIDRGYHPRPDWCYPTDSAIQAIARATRVHFASWSSRLGRSPDGRVLQPKVIVGPTASGNKIVDDLTDEAFAPVLRIWPRLVAVEMEAWGAVEAVQDAHERSQPTAFSMIRGISDCPLRPGQSGGADVRDSWKSYAADGAAAYARHLIESAWPYPPQAR
jgi:nucleoside phosphorylase